MAESGFVYFIRDPDPPPNGLVKIGKTKNVERRFKTFLTANPNLEIIGVLKGYTKLENQLHKRFANVRVTREWFRPIPEILKIAKGGKGMDFNQFNEEENDEEMDVAYPPMMPMPYPGYYPPMPYPGRSAPKKPKKDAKSEKEKAEEKLKKEWDVRRKKTNQFVDRAFLVFVLLCLLTLLSRVNY